MLCKFADFYVKVNPIYDYTKNMIKYFETTEIPSSEIITLGENFSEEDYLLYHREYPNIPIDEAEHIFLANELLKKILKYNAIAIHSSAVKYCDKCILFSADSGVGKSTHAKMWEELYHDKVKILNDDKPIVRQLDDELVVYGTPFAGGTTKFQNDCAKLYAIVFLERSGNNSIEEILPSVALRYLFKSIIRRIGKKSMDYSLDMLNNILENTKFYILHCNQDKSAAILAHDTIIKED